MVSTSGRLDGTPLGSAQLSYGRGAIAGGAGTPLAGGKNQGEWYPSLCPLGDGWQSGLLPTHTAASGGDLAAINTISLLEVLCAHAPATLEAKNIVRVVCRVLHPSRECGCDSVDGRHST